MRGVSFTRGYAFRPASGSGASSGRAGLQRDALKVEELLHGELRIAAVREAEHDGVAGELR